VARLFVADPRVRRLIEKLVPLVSASSVNRVCEHLNAALKPGQGSVYPNRIHALLSEDPTRALNQTSVDLIETAVENLPRDTVETANAPTQKESRLVADVLQQWRTCARSGTAVREVAEALEIPPAVVRYLLELSGELPKDSSEKLPAEVGVVGVQVGHPLTQDTWPDWSFQDVAVQRCVHSITAGPNRKVGLVLPTGAGKTRTALRIALVLAARNSGSNAPVLWVTHRKTLHSQARRELQKMLAKGIKDLPENAAELLGKRIEFIMVSQLEAKLADIEHTPLLVIVDEAHHAAAASYQPIFGTPLPLRGLFLTATPNRTDDLPIGIDEIAYTITYRELAERGVILPPKFEDFRVSDFEWSEDAMRDLADRIITRAADDYVKVLVLVSRVQRVEEFYLALQNRLAMENNHPLSEDDIGFVHGTGNSLSVTGQSGEVGKATTDEFIEHFAGKPRAIIVSAQILLEGFDDPEINAVVVTYASESLVLLMQAAGRCVRYTPNKSQAFVLQAKNELLAYHFDQRWLYQEISDYLRPQLVETEYSDLNQLRFTVDQLLVRHNVDPVIRGKVMQAASRVAPGEKCRLLLWGLPYFGAKEEFDTSAMWGAMLEHEINGDAFRSLFNTFCGLGAHASDPRDFLRKYGPQFGITSDLSEGSEWRQYLDMLTAMYFAGREIYGGAESIAYGSIRNHRSHGPTTWLKYVTFRYNPVVSSELLSFLQDCYNREAILGLYQADPDRQHLALKIPLPLGGAEAHLLDKGSAGEFTALCERIRTCLREAQAGEQFSILARLITELPGTNLPLRLISRIERFLIDSPVQLSLRLIADAGQIAAAESQCEVVK
jgi:superfamily II DNA or RNA helicase